MNSNCMKYKMLVFDLDGTLLNNEHRVTSLTLKVLSKLRNDFRIIIATGRRLDEIKDVMEQLKEIDIEKGYMITANGAEVFLQSNLILRYEIGCDLVREILKLERGEIDINLYTLSAWYSDRAIRSPIMNYFIHKLGIKPVITDLFALQVDSFSKIVYFSQNIDILENFGKTIRDRKFKGIHVFYSAQDLLEITNANASKHNAVKNVASLECVDIGDVLAFGDNGNDYEMLKNVGKGVVMRNANEFVKANLPNNEVTKFSNDEDGVAKFLIDFFNLDID
ncbi:Cof-type HAD-IIB family hydrolase [Borrelia sp. BU AG58]|uniref:Cof-type HAD-IIB family hydrolase n=1 Tax=Borrelia sp. BU AG58 TaxID=2887345 RepID=UPI001E539575|nr:Cof-type HAD-IIB family hydrolase [Borrelia sp. BU AG58]UER67596.1 Cof-type HAD-IIB family hydrolase [Borrelia sp. BU AG58]